MTEKVLILLTNNTNYLMMDGPTCDKKVLDEHENWLDGFCSQTRLGWVRFFQKKKITPLHFFPLLILMDFFVCDMMFVLPSAWIPRVWGLRPSACSSLTFYLFSDALLLVSASKLKGGVWRRFFELGQRNQDAWPMHHDNSDVDV